MIKLLLLPLLLLPALTFAQEINNNYTLTITDANHHLGEVEVGFT